MVGGDAGEDGGGADAEPEDEGVDDVDGDAESGADEEDAAASVDDAGVV